MASRVSDSRLYAHLWGTEELDAIFEERARLQVWLDVLVALARQQATLGIIPQAAADAIERGASIDRVDLDEAAEETRRTGHSTLGLIRALQRALPEHAREHVYYGATVQDVTDTWTALAMREVGALLWRDLRAVEERALDLARQHRDTPMAGRTHGQPGSPITFGLKAASWADEVRRHLERLDQGRERWLVGQLGGAVGSAGFFGDQGRELRARFCADLGLGDPGISWLTARDRVAEFCQTLAMISGTLARIGNEVSQLQRPEIGELAEPASAASVGSITMPHKRNPESSEHLVTLSRLVRAHADLAVEGMVGEHERDGRSWKVEWVAFPEACLLTGTAAAMARGLLDGLEVNAAAMAANLERTRGSSASEAVLSALAPRVGKHRAQALLQDALEGARRRGEPLYEALSADEEIAEHLGDETLRALVAEPQLGASGEMVDDVLARAGAARARERLAWP